jgi:hypothetical protein
MTGDKFWNKASRTVKPEKGALPHALAAAVLPGHPRGCACLCVARKQAGNDSAVPKITHFKWKGVEPMKNKPEPDSDLILYLTEDGRTRLQVRLEGETVWLSLNQMVDLFQREKSVISRHIKNVFGEGELSAEATVAKSATVQTEGGKQVTREIEFYNLDVIISVGYRVKLKRGTQFRIWATQRLREYIVKGFTMHDERLKNPPGKGHIDCFDELLERTGTSAPASDGCICGCGRFYRWRRTMSPRSRRRRCFSKPSRTSCTSR